MFQLRNQASQILLSNAAGVCYHATMSNVDRHVFAVRNKLALATLMESLAVGVLVGAVVVLVGLLIDRLAGYRVPVKPQALETGAASVGLVAVIYALWHRPSAAQAAVVIDQRLRLKETFSTALYAQSLNDPFAKAAVENADRTAATLSLRNHFPLTFPRYGLAALAMVLLAVLAFWFVPSLDLLGHRQAVAQKKAENERRMADAQKRLEQALEVVAAAPLSLKSDSVFAAKVEELRQLASGKVEDPGRVSRKAEQVLNEVEAASKAEAERTQAIADAQTATLTHALGDLGESHSSVKQVAQSLATGDFSAAVQHLEKTVSNFDKLDAQSQAQVAQDMEKLARQLAQAAADPQVQKQIQKQLQQLGMNQQQADEAAKDMAAAAQGDKQAADRLQQQSQQLQKQLQQQLQQAQQQVAQGNQQAAQQAAQLQQQQQQLNQALQKMQAMANAQAQAGNMAQAAQQMAAGMKQSAAARKGQPPGQQNAPGQSPAGQQQMAQARQQMQNALNQMQAVQADANQAAARQSAAQQAAQGNDGADGGQGAAQNQANTEQGQAGDGKGAGDGAQADAQGQQAAGQGNNGGRGLSGRSRDKQLAPFAPKPEDDMGVSRADGQILASTLVKNGQMLPGQAKAAMKSVTQSAAKAMTDEVEEDRISGASRKAAEEYFRVMSEDAAKK